MSLNPDAVLPTTRRVAEAEAARTIRAPALELVQTGTN
jgi:hypothetical protein